MKYFPFAELLLVPQLRLQNVRKWSLLNLSFAVWRSGTKISSKIILCSTYEISVLLYKWICTEIHACIFFSWGYFLFWSSNTLIKWSALECQFSAFKKFDQDEEFSTRNVCALHIYYLFDKLNFCREQFSSFLLFVQRNWLMHFALEQMYILGYTSHCSNGFIPSFFMTSRINSKHACILR